jgi:hypothetical protein
MTKDEALDLAQKALEDACGNRCNAEYNPCFQREAITAIKAAKEAKDEPVAVVSGYYGGQCVVQPLNPARIFNSGTVFYTTPPQRKPLTDEEIGDEFVRFQVGGMFTPFLYAVRAIEAAHGIKE